MPLLIVSGFFGLALYHATEFGGCAFPFFHSDLLELLAKFGAETGGMHHQRRRHADNTQALFVFTA